MRRAWVAVWEVLRDVPAWVVLGPSALVSFMWAWVKDRKEQGKERAND